MVTLRSTPTTATSGGANTSVTVNAPTGIQAGDLLILQFVASNAIGGTPPSGFQRIQFNSTTGTVIQQDVYSKIATASEPSTYSYTYTSGEACIIMAAYGNTAVSAAGNTVIDASGTTANNAASTTAAGATRTTTRNGDKILCLVATTGVVTVTAPTSNPGAYTRQAQQSSTTLVTAAFCDVDMNTTGATGAPSATLSGSQESIVTVIAIQGSFNQGNTAYQGPRTSTVSPSGDLSSPISSTGTYSASNKSTMDDRTITLINQAVSGTSPLPVPSSGVTISYKNTGYYVTGAVYESWITTNAPATTSVNPNTGHTLTNVSYVKLN